MIFGREEQAWRLVAGEASLTQARQMAYAAYRGGVVSLIEALDADSRLLAARAHPSTDAACAALAAFSAVDASLDAQAGQTLHRRPTDLT